MFFSMNSNTWSEPECFEFVPEIPLTPTAEWVECAALRWGDSFSAALCSLTIRLQEFCVGARGGVC